MNFEMKNEFIFCSPEKRSAEKTSGGLYLPESKKDENTQVYIITHVPQGCEDYEVGDRIVLDQNTYSKVKIYDDERYYILPQNIVCILTAEDINMRLDSSLNR
jgi:co-chaperonin GroES (HSP10)